MYKQRLVELLGQCFHCRRSCELKWTVIGTYTSVDQHCPSCDSKRTWASQPKIRDLPDGNLLLSASILFSGSSFSKISRFLSFMNILSISHSTLHSHQFLQPTIISLWKDTQQALVDWLSKRPGEGWPNRWAGDRVLAITG